MNHIILKQMIILFLILIMVATPFALEVETHKALNTYISQNTLNGYSLDTYIKSQLGFGNGIRKEFNYLKAWEWIRDGGLYEDKPPWTIPYTRSFNHFHDPLKPWDNSGLYGTFQSSVLWAQDQGSFGSLWGGNFSWKAVREYFYTALTGKDFNGNIIASTQTEKENYYSITFRGIGQIMHLVEDASVPAHTRDDAHVIGYHYGKEDETKKEFI